MIPLFIICSIVTCCCTQELSPTAAQARRNAHMSSMRRPALILSCLLAFGLSLAVSDVHAKWTYRDFKAGIDEHLMKTARTRSLKSLSLDFPYQGKNFGELILRNHAERGLSIMITIDRGQIMCARNGCIHKLKFDSEPSISVLFFPAANYDSTVLFASDPEELASGILKARRLKIELELYRHPPQILEFDLAGLDLKKIDRVPPPLPVEPKADKELPAPEEARSSVDNGITLPIPVNDNPHPDYPPQARRLGEEGRVVLRLLIKSDGKVGSIEMKTSSGFALLDEAAIESVRKWQFTPASDGKQPIDYWVNVPINFKIN